jgi:hypothetical protein
MADRNGDNGDEKEPLTQSQIATDPLEGWSEGNLLKYGSLGMVIVQNSSHVLLLRYSRITGGDCEGYVVGKTPIYNRLQLCVAQRHEQPSCRPWLCGLPLTVLLTCVRLLSLCSLPSC